MSWDEKIASATKQKWFDENRGRSEADYEKHRESVSRREFETRHSRERSEQAEASRAISLLKLAFWIYIVLPAIFAFLVCSVAPNASFWLVMLGIDCLIWVVIKKIL
jgi:Flp pilus assembly protein TadB